MSSLGEQTLNVHGRISLTRHMSDIRSPGKKYHFLRFFFLRYHLRRKGKKKSERKVYLLESKTIHLKVLQN